VAKWAWQGVKIVGDRDCKAKSRRDGRRRQHGRAGAASFQLPLAVLRQC
jgi:hypothetical protein